MTQEDEKTIIYILILFFIAGIVLWVKDFKDNVSVDKQFIVERVK